MIFIKQELEDSATLQRLKLTVASTFLTALTFAVIGALYYYGNWMLADAGVMIWSGSLPEQLWSAETGQHTREAPRTKLGDIGTILTFGSLPLVWYSLCQL